MGLADPHHVLKAIGLGLALMAAGPASMVFANDPQPPTAAAEPTPARRSLDLFLDRLMIAESGGRDKAKNPKSTALGPFQFIERTWTDVGIRHFASEMNKLSPAQFQALRTDRPFARRMAEAYTRDNAQLLAAAGHKPTYGFLRLAFFAGLQGTLRVLAAEPTARAVAVLGPGAARANPFLHGMTVRDLIARMGRDTGALRDVVFEGPAPTAAELEVLSARLAAQKLKSIPRPFVVRCNPTLPACRRWVALAEARARGPVRRTAVAEPSTGRAKRSRPLAER